MLRLERPCPSHLTSTPRVVVASTLCCMVWCVVLYGVVCCTCRARTEQLYTVYSKKPRVEIHRALHSLHVEYFVLERGSCMRRGVRPGCSTADLWDLADPLHAHVAHTFCEAFLSSLTGTQVDPSKVNPSLLPLFELVYASPNYAVLKIL